MSELHDKYAIETSFPKKEKFALSIDQLPHC